MFDDGHLMLGGIRLGVDANLSVELGSDERSGLDDIEEVVAVVVVLRRLYHRRRGLDVVLNGEIGVGADVLAALLLSANARVDGALLVGVEGLPHASARLFAAAELALRRKKRPDVGEGVSR